MIANAESYISYLNEELVRRLRSNPRYSMRAFARQLGLAPGELSEVMRGRRPLSLKSALKIAQALGFNQAETQRLVYLAQLEKSRALGKESLLDTRKSGETDASGTQLSMDLFHVVSDWYCFAILNLADCANFRWDPAWIARRLGISAAEARAAISRLERVGLIERSGGAYSVAKDFVMSPSGIPSEAIRSYHRQILGKAVLALDAQKVEEREISGAGFAIDPDVVPQLKKEIADFLKTIAAKYSRSRRRTEVYQLEYALFRLTEGDNDGR